MSPMVNVKALGTTGIGAAAVVGGVVAGLQGWGIGFWVAIAGAALLLRGVGNLLRAREGHDAGIVALRFQLLMAAGIFIGAICVGVVLLAVIPERDAADVAAGIFALASGVVGMVYAIMALLRT